MRRDLITSVTRDRRLHGPLRARLPARHHRHLPGACSPNKADGSQIKRGRQGRRLEADRRRTSTATTARYFQSRPSATGYNPAGTFFNNLGPEQKDLRDLFRTNLAAYLKRERPYDPGLTARDVPVDAVTTSASGVDPHISQANARIQAHRVAEVRRLRWPASTT